MLTAAAAAAAGSSLALLWFQRTVRGSTVSSPSGPNADGHRSMGSKHPASKPYCSVFPSVAPSQSSIACWHRLVSPPVPTRSDSTGGGGPWTETAALTVEQAERTKSERDGDGACCCYRRHPFPSW